MLKDAAARLVVGGLGAPYDALLAAALASEGPSMPLGPLDAQAMRRGRSTLPRGQCAPLLATTGALLAMAEQTAPEPVTFLAAGSCGPCRYALFGPAWRRALAQAGASHVQVVTIEQVWDSMLQGLGEPLWLRALDALLAGDALALARRRLRPHVLDRGELDARCEAAADAIVQRIRAGEPPLAALYAERSCVAQLPLRPAQALGRVALIGDPWSLHVDGEAQNHVTTLLTDAGVEVESPPLALWLAYRLWASAQGERRVPQPAASAAELHEARERWLRVRLRLACDALGMRAELPSVQELVDLAAPYQPASIAGGYGPIEVGLAARVRAQRRAHVVISVKSFGCIPSSSIADAIVPAVLGRAVGFLAVEVCEEGAAVRESRLMLQIAAAQERAVAELAVACGERGLTAEQALAAIGNATPLHDPDEYGPRRYACGSACRISALPHRRSVEEACSNQ